MGSWNYLQNEGNSQDKAAFMVFDLKTMFLKFKYLLFLGFKYLG